MTDWEPGLVVHSGAVWKKFARYDSGQRLIVTEHKNRHTTINGCKSTHCCSPFPVIRLNQGPVGIEELEGRVATCGYYIVGQACSCSLVIWWTGMMELVAKS